MCFKSKVKTPKPQKPPAPEPVVLEEPKGIDYGSEDSGAEDTGSEEGDKITKIEREGTSTDIPSAFNTATSAKRKESTTSSAAVRKKLDARTRGMK